MCRNIHFGLYDTMHIIIKYFYDTTSYLFMYVYINFQKHQTCTFLISSNFSCSSGIGAITSMILPNVDEIFFCKPSSYFFFVCVCAFFVCVCMYILNLYMVLKNILSVVFLFMFLFNVFIHSFLLFFF